MGKYVLSEKENGQWHFVLQAGNGEVILSSQMYTDSNGALNGIKSCRGNSGDEANYDRLEASDGRWYFNLKAANSQIIGTSQMYASAQGRDKGIHSCMENGPDSPVDE